MRSRAPTTPLPAPKPTLRIASLAALRHPFSIDLYLERVCARAKLVVARVLGGADYWRYGVDELAALARRSNVKLALAAGGPAPRCAPGRSFHARERRGSADLALFRRGRPSQHGGVPRVLRFRARRRDGGPAARAGQPPSAASRTPASTPSRARRRRSSSSIARFISRAISRRSRRLPGRSRDKGFATTSVFVTSLKDEAALEPLRAFLESRSFDVVLNATAFSARLDELKGTALDALDAPVLQVVLAGVGLEAWRASPRGLSPSDLAMHVALPEIDGRILTRAISFKAARPRDALTEFGAVTHQPLADRVAFVAELARRWANLRLKAPSEKRLACVLPDYPARGGRTGYAVGLDTPASAVAISETLRAAGYDVACDLDAPSLIAALAEGPLEATLTLAEYEAELASTPADFRRSLVAAWGEPAEDRNAIGGAFRFRFARLGKLIVAVQPDRGDASSRKGDYHDLKLPPRHAYVAFHFWLTRKEQVDAIIQLGAHGTLEWLPGKAVALSESLRARSRARPDAGRLSLHRQQSRRGGAGQAPHRRGDDRPSDAAVDRRRIARRRRSSSKGCSTNSPRRRRSIRGAPAPSPRSSWSGGARADCLRNAPPTASRPRRRSSPSTRGSATSRTCASAMACMCSAARRRARKASPRGSILTRRRERPWASASPPAARPNRSGCCRALRRTLRRPRAGRRAGARPSRRAADRAQPLRHRPALSPDAQRLGDRATRRRGGSGALCAGPRRLAEAHRARPLGLGDHAHRRRRSRASLRAHRLPADLGRFVEPRQRLRGSAARDAGPAAGRCDIAHFRAVPRRLSEPDRAVRRRRSRCRRARGERRRQSARRT